MAYRKHLIQKRKHRNHTPHKQKPQAIPHNQETMLTYLQSKVGNQGIQRLLQQGQSDTLLQLKPDMGNQAMQKLVGSSAKRLKGTSIQRRGDEDAPDSDTGIADDKAVSEFAKEAHTYINDAGNTNTSLKILGLALSVYVQDMLTKAGVPPLTIVTSGGGDSLGSFYGGKWKIEINSDEFSQNPATTTIGQLTPAEASEIVNTLYHEARHAEQVYRVARMMAGEWAGLINSGINPDAVARMIKKSTGIPEDIAKKALADPLAATASAVDAALTLIGVNAADNAEIAEARIWYQSYRYANFVYTLDEVVKDLQVSVDSVDAKDLNTTILSIQNQINDLDTKWIPKIDETIKDISNFNTPEHAAVGLKLEELKIMMESFKRDWNNFNKAPGTNDADRIANIKALSKTAGILVEIQREAYEKLPEEIDAHQVGEEASVAYQSK